MGFKSPPSIAEAFEEIGRKKCNLSLPNMFVLAILAGVYIGFGAILATVIGTDAQTKLGFGLKQLLSGFVFSTGLMLVVIGGAELFTGNNLILIPWASKKVTIPQLLQNWVVVYIGNFVGALLLVLTYFFSGLYLTGASTGAIGISAVKAANIRVDETFIQAFLRGILCNILVCLAVWLAVASESAVGKIFGIMFPIMAFVTAGFEHCVANMYFVPAGILMSQDPAVQAAMALVTPAPVVASANLNWFGFIMHLIPATLGNIVGGALFVGGLYWFVYRRGVTPSCPDPNTGTTKPK